MRKYLKNHLILFFATSIILIQSNCATPGMSSKVSSGSKPNPGTGYVFGSFYQQKVYGVSVGLVLLNVDTGKKIHIEFSRDILIIFSVNPVFAVAVPPGRYRVSEIFGTDTGLFYNYRKVIPPEDLKHFSDVFVVKRGSAVYIGDYNGYSKRSGFYKEWGLLSMKDNYTGTVEKFKKKYEDWSDFQMTHAFGVQLKINND